MTSLAFLFINSPREYLAAVVAICVLCSLLFVLLCIGIFKWAPRSQMPRRPLRVPERIRLPREPFTDLAAVRDEHERLKEAHQEEVLLRRAS